jgi:hypothetical protein
MSSAFEETRWQSAVDEVAVSFAVLHAKKSDTPTNGANASWERSLSGFRQGGFR